MKTKKYPFTQNRELSWLKFNQRVLEEAADPRVALLERLKFVAIFTSNLDEFFMVRCGSLLDMSLVDNKKTDNKSGMTSTQQLEAIYSETSKLYKMRDTVVRNLTNTLREVQIEPLSFKNLNKKQTKFITSYFEKELSPLLAPQIMDVHHPFPFLINKECYIFFRIVEEGKTRYGIVPIPSYLPSIIYLNEEKTQYIRTSQVILALLDRMFEKSHITFKTIIRVTRNADINLNAADIEDDEDYRSYMKTILKKRNRLTPIRLEVAHNIDNEALNYLCKQLHLHKAQVFISKHCPLDPSYLFSMIDKLPIHLNKAMSYKAMTPQTNYRLNPDESIMNQVLDHDVMLYYPYQDIDFFIRLLKEAASDPRVLSISITIYRLAKNSKVVKYLCRAAENGKNVTVLMELRARFDEQNNIQAAERLEEAGVNVFYGFDDYKVHSKLMLMTLKDHDHIRTITQIGTGNYNEKTSHQYTDFSLMTPNPEIGMDATAFFQNMNVSNLHGDYKKLIVSPNQLKEAVINMLDEQIALAQEGKKARAWFKMNSLTDLELIAKLAEASQAGVEIRMIIRGICCILPGLKNYTENIEIHSIVGRFLEHGRMYLFGEGENEKIYISSADFMTRNTERRVEVGVPVEDEQLRNELHEYFELQFKDNIKGRKLLPSGYYTKLDSDSEELIDSQDKFIEIARDRRFRPIADVKKMVSFTTKARTLYPYSTPAKNLFTFAQNQNPFNQNPLNEGIDNMMLPLDTPALQVVENTRTVEKIISAPQDPLPVLLQTQTIETPVQPDQPILIQTEPEPVVTEDMPDPVTLSDPVEKETENTIEEITETKPDPRIDTEVIATTVPTESEVTKITEEPVHEPSKPQTDHPEPATVVSEKTDPDTEPQHDKTKSASPEPSSWFKKFLDFFR